MAEIRKFDPAAGNAIAQALKAAMGEPVRPNEPGRTASQTPQAQPTTTSWISLQVAPAIEEQDED